MSTTARVRSTPAIRARRIPGLQLKAQDHD
jgi:hypothetical protein